jgi:hypothetical protein
MTLDRSHRTDRDHSDWLTRRVIDPILTYIAQFGPSLDGVCYLDVRDRHDGSTRTVLMHVLSLDDRRYLVAQSGNVPWVSDLRHDGHATLRLGAATEHVHATAVADDDKPPILRAFLHRWGSVVGEPFDGDDVALSDAELRRIAPAHPVFRLSHR